MSAVRQIVERTFLIETPGGLATAFEVDVHGKVLIVTAAHLFPEPSDTGQFSVVLREGKKLLDFNLVKWRPADSDVVILKHCRRIGKPTQVALLSGPQFVTQPCYLAGFPAGLSSRSALEVAEGELEPFVVRTSVAAFGPGTYEFWMDRPTIGGFSGGPIFCVDAESSIPTIVGVASATFRVQFRDGTVDAVGRTFVLGYHNQTGLATATAMAAIGGL